MKGRKEGRKKEVEEESRLQVCKHGILEVREGGICKKEMKFVWRTKVWGKKRDEVQRKDQKEERKEV